MSVTFASRSWSSPTNRLSLWRSFEHEETNEHNGESPKDLVLRQPGRDTKMRGGGAEGRKTYEKYKFYVGFELNPLARDGTGNSEDGSRSRPYKAGSGLASRDG